MTAIPRTQAAPATTSMVFEHLPMVPEGWTQIGTPSPEQLLRFRIAVQSPKLAEFHQHVLDISTPDHPRYGLHMKRDEVKAMLRPAEAATESVLEWLHNAGVSRLDIEDDGEWINFVTSVSNVERLLETQFHIFRNDVSKMEGIRTLQYSVPQHLYQSIDMIQPTTRFGQMHPDRSTVHDVKLLADVNNKIPLRVTGNLKLQTSGCNETITPACLRELYEIGEYRANPNTSNKLGIAGYLEEYAQYEDLRQFLARYAPDAAGGNFTVSSIKGGLNVQGVNNPDDSIEANLDVQYALSLSYSTPTVYYSTPGRGALVPDLLQPDQSANSNEPYLDFLDYMLKLPDSDLPQTLTTSYGEPEQSLPESYTRTVCNMFAQLGARGVSILFSSGDSGPGNICVTNDGQNRLRFQPSFPATCPWVTAVGGTVHVEPEEVVFFSSGGFSDRFERPAYQKDAVETYLSKIGDKFSPYFNRNGRGFPDVAAQGSNFQVVDKGEVHLVGGTSASAPTFAGIVALLNSARVAAKKPPLGFLNPWIYSQGRKGLTDIVKGGSRGCEAGTSSSGVSYPGIPYASWNATDGWDPATGLGSPRFQTMLGLIGVQKKYS
ncbi:MAG: vesicle formation at the endoplasmic reticulum [Peltula sp. TS41687]|nr:MAG: vesicle formation at the endoplasmic reticulum [Peltula sp. TS41687]